MTVSLRWKFFITVSELNLIGLGRFEFLLVLKKDILFYSYPELMCFKVGFYRAVFFYEHFVHISPIILFCFYIQLTNYSINLMLVLFFL